VFVALDVTLAASPPDPVTPALLDALAEQLVNVAFLTNPTLEWRNALRDLLRTAPFGVQQRWAELIKFRVATLRNGCSCVACRGHGSPGLVFADVDAGRCVNCSLRRLSPLSLLGDASLLEMRSRQMEGLDPSGSCEARLQRDFNLLCNVADRIDIVDPYAVTDALRSMGSSGLERLLAMAEVGGVGEVRLLTGVGGRRGGKELTANDLAREAARIGAAAGLRATALYVEVVCAKGRVKYLHDRFVGFYWGSAGQLSWSLGSGLSQFNGAKPKRFSAMSRQKDGFVSSLGSVVATKAVLTRRVN